MVVFVRRYRIVKMSKPPQYACRFLLKDGGRSGLIRLKHDDGTRFVPTASKYEDEPRDLRIEIEEAVLQVLQERILSERLFAEGGKYKTCGQAMKGYEKWHIEKRKNARIKYCSRMFIEHFGEKSLVQLTRNEVQAWIEALIRLKYSFDTVRLLVMTGSGMITWMEQQNQWQGKNPFSGQLKNYKNRFPAHEPAKSYFNNQEMGIILRISRQDRFRAARVFIEVARLTGLRPSEIYNINTQKLDRENLTLEFLVTKTQDRQFYRKIAVPKQLAIFLTNEGINDKFPYSEWDVRVHFEALRKELGMTFSQKTFRKDFAHRMEMAGASLDAINLHQGRSQYGVLCDHYLTDTGRAVRVCRPFITSMFGETPTISRVK
jgi:integrase